MTIQDKRRNVVSKIKTLNHQQATNRGRKLTGIAYRTRKTRLNAPAIEGLYDLLTERSGWGASVDTLRDRLRISVLEVNDYDDDFDGRPFRSDELDALSETLDSRIADDSTND